jgi:hypothetical protein
MKVNDGEPQQQHHHMSPNGHGGHGIIEHESSI